MFGLMAMGIGVVTALLVAELVLRVAGWPAPGFYGADGSGPILGEVPGRNGGIGRVYHGWGRDVGYDFNVPSYINRHGIREREPHPKAEGTWRIGLLGDSYAAGHGVEEDERFGNVWMKLMADRLPNVELWTIASGWAGTAHVTDMLEGFGSEYELDELILAFYGGNDLLDTARWYRYSQDGGLTSTQPNPTSSRLRKWLREHLRVSSFLWVMGKRVLGVLTQGPSASAETVEQLWPDTERALGRLVRVAAGRPLTIWYLPDITEWDYQIWQTLKEKFQLADVDRRITRERLRAWSRAQGVRFVDCTPSLAGQRAEDLVLGLVTDQHWNRAGHKRIAEGLAGDVISAHRLRVRQ